MNYSIPHLHSVAQFERFTPEIVLIYSLRNDEVVEIQTFLREEMAVFIANSFLPF